MAVQGVQENALFWLAFYLNFYELAISISTLSQQFKYINFISVNITCVLDSAGAVTKYRHFISP